MRFLKNIGMMGLSNIIVLIFGLISAPIYVRFIGLKGMAIVGTVFIFFELISRLDLPFFLTFVKTKINIKQISSLLLNYIIISSAALLVILVPVVTYLSRIYARPDYLVYFLISIVIFLLQRNVNFHADIIRSQKKEKIIVIAQTISQMLEFIVTIGLLITGYGVIAIFIGALVSVIINAITLSVHHLITVGYEFTLDMLQLIKILRSITLKDYGCRLVTGIYRELLLFIATFFFPQTAIGVLAIANSLRNKLRSLYNPIWYHISPIILENRLSLNRKIIEKTNFIVFIVSIVGIVVLSSVGKWFYELYYGSNVLGTYNIIFLVLTAALISHSIICLENYLYVKRTQEYLRFNIFFLTVSVFSLLLAASQNSVLFYSFILVVLSIIRSLVLIIIINKNGINIFPDIRILITVISIILSVLITLSSKSFILGVFTFAINSMLCFIMFKSRILNNLRYITTLE